MSQITIGYDYSLGHTFEVFHSFDSMLGKPKDQNQKEKVKILCTIDSNDKICSVSWDKDGEPCEKFLAQALIAQVRKAKPSTPQGP